MTKTVDLEQFAAQMAQLFQEAEAGNTIVITRSGKPAVSLQRATEFQKAPPKGGGETDLTLWDALKDAPKAETSEEELTIDRKADIWRNDHFEFDPE